MTSVRVLCLVVTSVCLVGAGCGQTPPARQDTGTVAPTPAPQPAAGEGASPAAGQAAVPAASPAAATAPTAESPSNAPVPSPHPEPEFSEFTVKAGTPLTVVLDTGVSSGSSAVEDTVRGHLATSVRIGETKVLPAGSRLVGTVVEAQGAGKVKGRGRVAFRFDRITAHDEDYPARTSVYSKEARATKGKDAKKIGIGAGAGAVVGGLIGGGKGAAIGAGIGGGAGTGAVLATKGEEATVAAGAQVQVTLKEPVTVRVPRSAPK